MDWDAVVVGAGHHGLVAANMLADAGWSVLVLEANDTVGGATRTAELAAPGFRSDVASAFYPLTAASPALRELELERWGLHLKHDRHVPLVQVMPDDRTVTLSRDVTETAASVEEFAPGDGDRWIAAFEQWQRIRDDVLATTRAGREWILLFERIQAPAIRAVMGDEQLTQLAADVVTKVGRVAADDDNRLDRDTVTEILDLLTRMQERAGSPEINAGAHAVREVLEPAVNRTVAQLLEGLLSTGPDIVGD